MSVKRLISGSDDVLTHTDFSRDVSGRYVCNPFPRPKPAPIPTLGPMWYGNDRRNDVRPFDFIVIGSGTFGTALAEHLSSADSAGVIGLQTHRASVVREFAHQIG